MEVLVGPTFSIEVSSPPPYVVPSSQDKHHHTSTEAAEAVSPSCIFLKQEEDFDDGGSAQSLISSRIGQVDSSDSSSSIGAPDDSEDDEEEVESVVSSKGGLGSLESLEDSLPIKRGLSNHFTGKSKSFANLSDMSVVATVKDLEKPENPFNKRRRLVMANKWYKKSSFYSWANPKSMPLLASLDEEEIDDQQQQEEDAASPSSSSSEQEQQHVAPKLSKLQERKFNNSFKSHSCFSLTDLQQQY